MATSLSFIDAVVHRRTIYPLTKSSPIPDSRILDLVATAAKHVPSSFDSQSTRLVVLLGSDHDKFWDFVSDAIYEHVKGTDKEAYSMQRIAGFKAGKGTILFFESQLVVDDYAAKWAAYADQFPQWSEHTSAMHQFVLWTALEAEGLGANLQHYGPLVEQRVRDEWKLEADWSLKAQLVFGGLPADKARGELLADKDVAGREERWVRVFGAQQS